ncbi:DUF5334 family protein [Rhizobium phaseoli]|uniref:DUF5334 family protein n=1 Tax=Rhizobium phaseoli TaxID=396 RepID=UPI001FDEB635|nr:DUF5334 family protein [Rhizobium phaseoli]
MPLRTLAVLGIFLAATASCLAWDGVDSETGASVEIGKGNLVRSGETIEIFDQESGEYRDVDVQSIQRSGSSIEVEVYDSESGEYRTLEMDD